MFLLAFILAILGATADDNNLFIFPTAPGPSNNFVANEAWPEGSTQTIQWTTTLDSYYIALFQQSIDPPSGEQLETIYSTLPSFLGHTESLIRFEATENGAGTQKLTWRVQTYDSDLSFSPVYFLWLNPGADDGFSSHYFNITDAGSKLSSSLSSSQPSSVLTSSQSSSQSSSTVTSGNTVSATTTTATSNAAATSPNADSTALKVGLGVGLGIGIPLTLIAGAWVGMKLVKQRVSARQEPVPQKQPTSAYETKPRGPGDDTANWEPKQHEIHEVDSQRTPAELGGEPVELHR